ncbi:HNH endonuclease domain-containing protein [Myxococcus stipitatus DSM 14675]|uniref:HNH endonuclease domain-containing protein n=1 Tax=Myxococcus stipitatus (strain DSM 14675 / JCM 12634 / Mx s8) TaxID=1278073 RepID=L7UIY6_MYXSD|nr:HNH endonuclease [Myxococcus stipitatus]AGC47968.1 HNH endonuclease domain-containing protein [Myxococcus stipitatus DSM 14675]
MSDSKRRRILAIIATDTTFERTEHRGREAWLGKCLHCNAHLVVGTDGEPISRATIEHILPRTAGGTDALENLGLACARCNQGKGSRHDRNYPRDARARELVERLQARRAERWRTPEDADSE